VQISTIAGGAGAVFSTGLLRRLNPSLYESCIYGKEAASGGPTNVHGEISAARYVMHRCSARCAHPEGRAVCIKLELPPAIHVSLQEVMPF
jgi:hypothetical protein